MSDALQGEIVSGDFELFEDADGLTKWRPATGVAGMPRWIVELTLPKYQRKRGRKRLTGKTAPTMEGKA